MLRRLAIAVAAATLGAIANGQARSAFANLDWQSDIFVQKSSNPLDYTLSLGAHPTISLSGHSYDVVQVFGCWALSNGQDLAATGADLGQWSYDENSTNVAGWVNANKKQAILPGHSKTFSFTALDNHAVSAYGLHVQTSQNLPTGGNTVHVAVVPDPAGAVAFATGIASLLGMRLRRRR